MRMFKLFLTAVLFMAALPSFADQSNDEILVFSRDKQWFRIAMYSGSEDWLRQGSSMVVTTNGGERVAKTNGLRKFQGKIQRYQWYVSIKHCEQGYGTLVATTMSGEFHHEAEFVEDGGSVGTQIAFAVCSGYRGMKERGEVQ